jgi:RNA polymerase sigma-70 factor (ECF subfamily)
MHLDPALQSAMLAAMPNMRAFALSLCHRRDRADDLVQEALARAIGNIRLFKPGTNMKAWLFTILRNNFFNEYRKSRHEVADVDGYYVGSMTSQPYQEAYLQFAELRTALEQLPRDQREALVLVGVAGLSYEAAAKLCRCAVGTMKSRTFRGRMRLAELMSIDGSQDLGPDRGTQAALTAGNQRWAA